MRGLAEVLTLLAAGTALALALVRIVHLLHMLQLEEYDTRRFVHWAVLHSDRLAANPMLDLLGLLGVVVLFLPLQLVSSEGVITCGLSIAVGLTGLLWERRLRARSPVKKALVMTPRARRLLACAAIQGTKSSEESSGHDSACATPTGVCCNHQSGDLSDTACSTGKTRSRDSLAPADAGSCHPGYQLHDHGAR